MPRQLHIAYALALICIVALTSPWIADGQVPTAVDVAACNDEAPQSIKAGSASPTAGDLARAANVRRDATTATPIQDKGKVIESADPQIHGMNAEGARDAAYQAAFRSCMRRKGF
jgi:hypothetical protein